MLDRSIEKVAAELAKLPQGRPPTQADWRRISVGYKQMLDDRIAALTRTRDLRYKNAYFEGRTTGSVARGQIRDLFLRRH